MKYKKLKLTEYTPSLLSNEKKCYFCGSTHNLECHHIFGGANRNKSSAYGCWVWLCKEHHTGNSGVHLNYELQRKLRENCQREFEKIYPYLDFMAIFGKNYL